MSEWSHLANAKHIDRIIAHAKANPKAWDTAYNAAYNTFRETRDTAYDAGWHAAKLAGRTRALDAAMDAAWAAAWYQGASRDTLLALVVWDRAGGLMDLPAEQVKVLAILGDQAAILMYLAIAAMETTQELA